VAGEDVRILLVEDSQPIRIANESALRHAGYEVICAEDGVSALKMAQDGKPDLILLDMILPKMGGPEVLTRLKKNPDTFAIPVVVVSSLSEKNRLKLMEAGAEDYLTKNELMPAPGVNKLPNLLETIICRINRKRDAAVSNPPIRK
jgi:CheY-like chemotaxis protein